MGFRKYLSLAHSGNPSKEEPVLATNNGWRPASLSAPSLLLFAAFSFILAAVIEILAQRSQSHGGLALSPSSQDIPDYAMFAYLYVPNIIAVLYSLTWNWIDLDIKRIQPWIEMSSPTGVAAKRSILLDYPSEFLILVPWKAGRRRHWPVFLSATIMLIIMLIVTPLQATLFRIATTEKTKEANVTARSSLVPVSEQENFLDSRNLFMLYDITWLGQPFPAFTTADYALLPFYVDGEVGAFHDQKNWTATTTKLWTELNCTNTEVEKNGTSGQFVVTTVDNCTSYSPYPAQEADYMISNWYDIWGNHKICPTSLNGGYIGWIKKINVTAEQYNFTVMHCDELFYKQDVLATVTQDLRPIDGMIQPLSDPVQLTSKDINTTAYARFASRGGTVGTGSDDAAKDYPFTLFSLIQNKPPMKNLSTDGRITPFAIARNSRQFDKYSDPSELVRLYESAYKPLFSVAVANLVSNDTTWTNQTATTSFRQTGISVNRTLSAVSEALLILIGLSACVILYLHRSSSCNLQSNPSSLSWLLKMAHNSFGIKDKVWKLGAADEKGLEKQLDHLHLRLSVDESKGQNCLIMETSNSYTDSLSTTNAIYEPVKPLILRRTTGLVFMCVLVSAAVVLACFKRKEEANNGLTLPSNNRNVLNILESYLPTVFATIVGAVWILLTRTRCLLQPFQDLWTGKSKPSRSLDATYTSLPPQLVLVRAILSRHFILALLCIITLLGYVLSVGLASLFNEKPTTISNAQLFRPVVQSRFNNSFIMGYYHNTDADVETYNGYNEHKYITLANMTLGLTLPPWVSKEYYFLPHTIVKTGKTNSTDTYKLTTRGFGIDTTCASVPEAPINENTPESDYMSARRECPDILRSIRGWVNATVDAVGPSSQDAFLTWPQRDPINPCEKRFVMSWARLPKNGNTSTDITTSFAICQPSFRTAMFNITVDTDGYILDYKRVGEFNLTMTDSKSQNATDSLIITLNRAHRMSSQPSWRNDSYSNDWMSYFMVLENGRDFLDPNQPVPDPGTLIPSVNKIYKQLFATLLSVDKGFFEASSDINSVSGTRLTYETRIFMDEPAFIISMTILAFDLIVGIIFYARKPFFVLPRIPSSIGSVLAYIAPSRAVQNGKPKSGWGGQSFSFGKYIGYDGETHVGIELDPHVSRLDRSLLSGKKSSSLSLDSASVGGETSTVIQNNTEARPLLPTIPNKSQTRGRVDDDESNN